jgi:hypothetical protein
VATNVNTFARSSGAYSDASFLRLKSLSVSYNLGNSKKIKFQSARIFLNAQNLITITKYMGHDPETTSFYSLPPLRTIVLGFQLTL